MELVSGIFIIFLVHVLLSFEYKSSGYFQSSLSKIFTTKNISRSVLLTFIVLILPIVVLLLLLALVYKVFCSVIIKKDKYFVGFLDSFDVFWSLEDENTKSIINVVGVIESDTPHSLANNIKEKLRNIVPKNGSEKIFYRRNEKYGFYYWRKYSYIDMDQYVDIIDLPNRSECSKGADLEYLMSDLQNQSLPYKGEGLFKILITRQRVGDHGGGTRGDYGIIFRVHHSVGDGVALIEFLCQTFAEKTDGSLINMFSMPESCNHDSTSTSNILVMMKTLLRMPLCFIDGIIRKPDYNALHGPRLLGKKYFKWTKSDENLLAMIKDIKENVKQINFSDILLTALSRGLKDFLSERVVPIPDDVAVILPVRFPKSSNHQDLMMKNDFSVTILDVPVKDVGNVNKLRDRCKTLRKSADPLTNYYFLKLVCSVLPKWILDPVLTSRQATMVFSNMPGPATLHLCGGNQLKSLVFFVPLKGNTGLGITALCYGGELRFAAVADEALVSSSEDLDSILDGMMKEIARLHARYVK
ncbi:hypothetical protein O0L34_g16791 [Tuta absoluta]|nr:hypothetical protein O0L34_g16791 [Tuta absoluta]